MNTSHNSSYSHKEAQLGALATREAFQNDTDRSNDLALTRWRIVLVTWWDLLHNPNKVRANLPELER